MHTPKLIICKDEKVAPAKMTTGFEKNKSSLYLRPLASCLQAPGALARGHIEGHNYEGLHSGTESAKEMKHGQFVQSWSEAARRKRLHEEVVQQEPRFAICASMSVRCRCCRGAHKQAARSSLPQEWYHIAVPVADQYMALLTHGKVSLANTPAGHLHTPEPLCLSFRRVRARSSKDIGGAMGHNLRQHDLFEDMTSKNIL